VRICRSAQVSETHVPLTAPDGFLKAGQSLQKPYVSRYSPLPHSRSATQLRLSSEG
jgi:hypothetical protein